MYCKYLSLLICRFDLSCIRYDMTHPVSFLLPSSFSAMGTSLTGFNSASFFFAFAFFFSCNNSIKLFKYCMILY